MIYDYSVTTSNAQLERVLTELLAIKREHNEMNVYLLYHPHTSDSQCPLYEVWQKNNKVYPISYANYASKRTPVLIKINVEDIEHQKMLSDSLSEALSEIHPALLAQFKPRKVYGWLLSSLTAQALAQQIGFIAIQARDKHQELIRYYDPMILTPFISILNETQRNKVLRPVSHWLYLNGDGQLDSIQNHQKIREHLSSELAISAEQWAMIDDIVVRNQVLTRYRKTFLDIDRMSENECNKIIWSTLSLAKENGYSQQQDLIEYCYYSLIIDPRIMSHTKITNQIKNNSHQLKKVLAQFSSQDWQTMLEEIKGIR